MIGQPPITRFYMSKCFIAFTLIYALLVLLRICFHIRMCVLWQVFRIFARSRNAFFSRSYNSNQFIIHKACVHKVNNQSRNCDRLLLANTLFICERIPELKPHLKINARSNNPFISIWNYLRVHALKSREFLAAIYRRTDLLYA